MYETPIIAIVIFQLFLFFHFLSLSQTFYHRSTCTNSKRSDSNCNFFIVLNPICTFFSPRYRVFPYVLVSFAPYGNLKMIHVFHSFYNPPYKVFSYKELHKSRVNHTKAFDSIQLVYEAYKHLLVLQGYSIIHSYF